MQRACPPNAPPTAGRSGGLSPAPSGGTCGRQPREMNTTESDSGRVFVCLFAFHSTAKSTCRMILLFHLLCCLQSLWTVAFGAQVQPCASALKQEVPSGSTSTKYKTNTTSSTCRETRGSVWPQINGTLSAATDGFSYKLKPEAGAGIRQQRSARDRCESLQRVTVLPTGGDGFLAEQQWALHWQP